MNQRTPNRYSKPIVFWALNHKLEEDELRRQLKEMSDKRVGGVILHPRSGLLTPYLTDEFFEMIGFIIEEAEKLGLDVWLYDEDPYPSGIAGGQVIADHPEYRAQILKYETRKVCSNEKISMDIPMEKIIGAFAVRRENGALAEVRDIRSHMGLLRTQWQTEHKYNTYYPTSYTKANPQLRADTYKPFYTLKWQADEREWDIVVLYSVYCGDYWLYPSYTDMLNPEAIEYFIDLTYEPYKKRFEKYFGNVVRGFFVDEPKYLSDPLPWTDKLPQYFENANGYPIEKALVALVFDFAGAEKMRRDFWDAVQDRFLETFPKQIAAWCERNNLELIGHCSPEEEPVDQVRYTGSIMNFMRSMTIPSTDLITYQVGDDKFPILPMSPINVSSAARQWRNAHALCETFGVTEWRLKYDDMIWMLNWLYTFGVDIFVFHAFMYSTDGYRKMDAGPSEFYQNPQWEYFGQISQYIGRVSQYMDTMDRKVDTAMFYPFDSWEVLFNIHHNQAFACRDEFCAVMNELIHKHCQFDFADVRDFETAQIVEGRLVIGSQSYSSIVVPPIYYLSELSRAKFEECARKGIRLYVCISDTSVSEWTIDTAFACFSIKGSAADGFEFGGFQCPVNEKLTLSGEGNEKLMVMNGEKTHWISNPTRESITVSYKLNTPGCNAEVFNPLTGEKLIISAESTVTVSPRGAVIISETAFEAARGKKPRKQIKELSGFWQFRTERRNVLRLGEWTLSDFTPERLHINDYEKTPYAVRTEPLGKSGVVNFPAEICYSTYADIDGFSGKLSLLKEFSGIDGKWEVYANGRKVDNWKRSKEYDCMTEEADLTPYLTPDDKRFYRKGELYIAVKLHAEEAANGLLQPMYLLGDFTVRLNNHESVGAELLNRKEKQILHTGSWADQGYPHYAGLAVYSQIFDIEETDDDARYFIEASTFNSAHKVYINGREAGIALAEPFATEVTGMIRPGRNEIEIEIASTPENMFYDLHAPFGLSGPVCLTEEK